MSHSVFPFSISIYVLPPAQVSPETVDVEVLPRVAGPEVAAVSEAAVSEAAVSEAAEPEAAVSEAAVSEAAVSEAAVSEAAVSEAAVSEAAVSEAAVSEAAEPEVVFAARLSAADVSGPQASVDIALVFDVLLPVSVVVVEVDSPGHPRSLAFPNVDQHASSSSSVGVVGQESVRSSTCALANYGLYSILSNPGLHQNRNLELCYNNPNPDHNNVSDTNDLPIGATTTHSRKKSLHLYQEQHTHR